MKNILTLAILLVFVFGFSQTKNDTIDFNHVNYTLLNDLIFQKHNEERVKDGSPNRIKENVCKLSSQYQADYMSQNFVICHDNDKSFRGVFLHEPSDRFDYFCKGSKIKSRFESEICFYYAGNSRIKYTYDQLAQEVIDSFLSSDSHKTLMLSGLFSFSGKQYGFFSTASSLKNGYFRLYVTGVFSHHLD